jgi:hypothetical protein
MAPAHAPDAWMTEGGMERSLRVVQTLRMARGEVGRVVPRRGTVLRVLRGRVWLTEYGGGRDWALACGSAHPVQARGVAVLECTAPAIVEVAEPVPWWHPVLARFGGSARSALCLCAPVVRSVTKRGNPA